MFLPHSAGAWTQTQFVLGTFWDPCLHCYYYGCIGPDPCKDCPFYNCDPADPVNRAGDIARFQRAKDAYFNLLTGFGSTGGGALIRPNVDLALGLAAQVGLKYFAADYCVVKTGFSSSEASDVVAHYTGLDQARRDAQFGYNIWDEPKDPRFDNGYALSQVHQWIAYFKANDPSRLAYVNISGSGGTAPIGGRSAWETYVDQVVNDPNPANNPDIVAFDQYPIFIDPAAGSGDSVATNYFYNLQTIRTKAGARPFWAHVMSTGHYHTWGPNPPSPNYAEPTEERLRFMAMCPVAYGAKGLIYFTYEKPSGYCDDAYQPYDSCWVFRDAIENDCNNPVQPKYDQIKRMNRYITNVLGPVVMNSTSLGAFHKSSAPTGEVMYPSWLIGPDTPVVSDLGDPGTMVGVFRDNAVSTTYYLLIVNKQLFHITTSVALRGMQCVSAAPSMVGYSGATEYTPIPLTLSVGDNTARFTLDLEGGEGRLIKITDVSDPSEWRSFTPTTPPAARWDASLIYDAGGDRFVLFGGTTTGGIPHNDVWTFSPATGQWATLATAGTSPPAISGHAAIYDPGRTGVSRRMLVTDGRNVWALSLTGTLTWSPLSTTGPAGFPAARDNFVVVYDSQNDQMVICGGRSDASTWKLPLGTLAWSRLADMPTTYTHRAAGAYDQVNRRMLVFGGFAYQIGEECPDPITASNGQVLALALPLSPAPPAWSTLPQGPWEATGEMAALWDSTCSRVVVIGGSVFGDLCATLPGCSPLHLRNEAPLGDVWIMDPTTGSWSQLRPKGCPQPPGRGHHVAAYRPGTDPYALVFGGGSLAQQANPPGCGMTSTYTYLNDTWAFDPDIVPPAAAPLGVIASCDALSFSWTAPGDDGTIGNAAWYQLRLNTVPITDANFSSSILVTEGQSQSVGSPEAFDYFLGPCSARYYYGLRVRDEAYNWSPTTTTGRIGTTCPAPGQMCGDSPGRLEAPTLPSAPELKIGPTPARTIAGIDYALPIGSNGSDYRLTVVDLLGRRVRALGNGVATPGWYRVQWDLRSEAGSRVATGVYFVRLALDGRQLLSRRVLVTR